MATFTITSTTMITTTRPTAPQAITAPEKRRGAGAGAGRAPGRGLFPPPAPFLSAPVACPTCRSGALPETGRLWALLRSLALWPVLAPAGRGFGLLPPTGVFFWSCAMVRGPRFVCVAGVSVTGRTEAGFGYGRAVRPTGQVRTWAVSGYRTDFAAYTYLAMLQDAMSEASAA